MKKNHNTDKQIQGRKTQKQSHKQKLITEFTPSTGLRLRGPSPMGTDPINLLKWYKMVLESTSATANRILYKVFKTSLWNLQIGFQKQRKAK